MSHLTVKRIFLYGLSLIGLWILGLLFFVYIIQSDVYKNNTQTEAIIVLTGGAFRIETGIDLYRNKHAKYLYISGVNPTTNIVNRVKSNGLKDEDLDCCVVIEQLAKDTNDNALYATKWLHKNDIHTATIVTANYHMPRSMTEFELLNWDVKFYPFSIDPESVIFDRWWFWDGSRQLIVEEYNKFLYAGFKLCFAKILNFFSI